MKTLVITFAMLLAAAPEALAGHGGGGHHAITHTTSAHAGIPSAGKSTTKSAPGSGSGSTGSNHVPAKATVTRPSGATAAVKSTPARVRN